MTQEFGPKDAPVAAPKPLEPRVLSSRDLLAGAREVIIQHGQEQYRLRLTSSNKLILVK
jgi:hemin uptake protein HemP